MQFLELNEIEQWCTQNSVPLQESERVYPETNPSLSNTSCCFFNEYRLSGRERSVSASCVQALGEWDECLLWITQWGVWTSSEDWPRYYQMRGDYEEKRSLETAPGHLFAGEEKAILINFLCAVIENGWDAFVFPAYGAGPERTRAFISHDEWIDIDSAFPIEAFAVAPPSGAISP